MKRYVWLVLLLFPLITIGGCTDKAAKVMQDKLIQTNEVVRYKLFPTQNMWTFIKVDTQTGQMWQVQYSVNEDKERLEYDLNPQSLIHDEKKINGRFELYPTQNIYNFILLDQINGKLWQVQWSFDEENRAILPINEFDN